MKTNCSITLYNRYFINRVETWQRSEVIGAEWEQRHARNKQDSDDLATVYIPSPPTTEYLSPKAWQALTNKSSNWTLQVGDVIVKGLVDEELGTVTLSQLKNLYDDVLVITSVDTRDFGSSSMHHWQVGAK